MTNESPRAEPATTTASEANTATQTDVTSRLAALEAALKSRPTQEKGKDFWDKLGSVTTLVSSVVIGAAGVIATYIIQSKQLAVKHLEVQQEAERRNAQDKANQVIQKSKTLESFLKYVASPKEQERSFGYAMFAALGQEDLALRLMTSTADKAGLNVARGLADSQDPAVAGKARNAYATIQRFEPPPPSAPWPYHLDLATIVDSATMAQIKRSGQLAFQVTGNTGGITNPQPQLAVAHAMQSALDGAGGENSRPAFLYLLGNIVFYYGETAYYFDQFYQPYAHYNAPIFAIPGNHDGEVSPESGSTRSLEAYARNFYSKSVAVMPEAGSLSRTAMTEPNCYWTLETPFATIIGLYTNVPPRGFLDEDQRSWLLHELQTAPQDKAVIVALHHSPYSFDNRRAASAVMAKEIQDAINGSRRVPNLVLSAATFNYQRIEVVAAEGILMPFLVVGNGGYRNLHRISNKAGARENNPEARLMSAVGDRHGFATIHVSSSEIRGSFTSVSANEEPQAVGKVDEFVYSAKPLLLKDGQSVSLTNSAATADTKE